jgi:molecular chaperone HtpG
MRRMKDMAAVGGSMAAFYAQMPDEVNLTINGNHPIFGSILAEEENEKQFKLVKNLGDLALLSQGLLTGKNLTNFISRSVDLMATKDYFFETFMKYQPWQMPGLFLIWTPPGK